MYIRPGDIFCSENPWIIGRAINAVQSWNALDGHAVYGHAGVLILPPGITVEALWKVKSQVLTRAYSGRKVLIGRHADMTPRLAFKGFHSIGDQLGKPYPLHRLPLFLIPSLARRISFLDWGVCSELTAKFLCGAGLMDFWSGVSPDDLADMIHNWKKWSVVFEGMLP